MRKVKNRWAAEMARRRWAGMTAEERRQQLAKAWAARSAKAAARRAAQAEEPEPVEA